MDIKNFTELCRTLQEKIDYNADGPAELKLPLDLMPLVNRIKAGAAKLPPAYQQKCVKSVFMTLISELQNINNIEPILGCVYDWDASEVLPQLQRFEAVISDLYLSFLSKEKRVGVKVKPLADLPPLATFSYKADNGPFTLPSDNLKDFGSVGVVSLPASYRNHPVVWAALAHETGGHDITHAYEGFIEELQKKVEAAIPNQLQISSSDNKTSQGLWSYWMDEAAADVFGLLNIGPSFAFNLAAFFCSLSHTTSTLRNQSGGYPDDFDVHPTDILRLHLAIGVTENLNQLSQTKRNEYVSAIQDLAKLCAGNATEIQFLDDHNNPKQSFPLAEMQEQARKAGAFIATVNLDTLGGQNIQDIETWSDDDEKGAMACVNGFKNNTPVVALGDDAQLLAGATLALLEQPNLYDQVTLLLNDGLDGSFKTDPIFGQTTTAESPNSQKTLVGMGSRE